MSSVYSGIQLISSDVIPQVCTRGSSGSCATDAYWLQASKALISTFPCWPFTTGAISGLTATLTFSAASYLQAQVMGGGLRKGTKERRRKKISCQSFPKETEEQICRAPLKRLTAKWKRATGCKFKSPKTPKRHNYNYCWGKLFKTKNTFPLTIKISFHCFFSWAFSE